MEVVISFFRDFLSGPLYIVVVVFSIIGILVCVGYLAEGHIKAKEEKLKYDQMYAHVHLLPVDEVTGLQPVSSVQSAFSNDQLDTIGQAQATNFAQNTIITEVGSGMVQDTITVSPTPLVQSVVEPPVVLINDGVDESNKQLEPIQQNTTTATSGDVSADIGRPQ